MIPQFESDTALLPAIIQDSHTGQVLMLGYMNKEAYDLTASSGTVTFYSRSREKIWVKGETSGNFLRAVSIEIDCDGDTILVQAVPTGPVCHTGSHSCFGRESDKGFLHRLQSIIKSRAVEDPNNSYTASLIAKGINKVAQKVGEEAVEVVIAAMDDDNNAFTDECADLLYHLSVLLDAKGITLEDVEARLRQRHKKLKQG